MLSSENTTILLVAEHQEQAAKLIGALAARPYRLLVARSAVQALHLLDAEKIDVVIGDMSLRQAETLTFLGDAQGLAPETTRVVIVAQDEVSTAVANVNDALISFFLLKPWQPAVLTAAISSIVAKSGRVAPILRRSEPARVVLSERDIELHLPDSF